MPAVCLAFRVQRLGANKRRFFPTSSPGLEGLDLGRNMHSILQTGSWGSLPGYQPRLSMCFKIQMFGSFVIGP
jgi:hypothetical protein